MVRPVPIQEDPPSDDDLYSAPSRTSRVSRTAAIASSSISSPSSDKENASAPSAKTSKGKGKETDRSGGRLAELSPTQALHNKILEEEGDKDAYDPDQDPEERRQVKKEYRELQRKLNDSKTEYLQPNSTGLYDTFAAAETLFTKVKQTSDATIDSRLLVQATDLALKKATNLTYGTAGIGIDADEFVGKCISFMRNNSRARRDNQQNGEDEEDGPTDDAMDWAYLGREAAFKGNKRPATIDFLLGPLSVTKKVRVIKARRQGLRRDNANLVRPVEVTQDPNAKAESSASAMSTLVKKIYDDLKETFRKNPVYNEDGLNLFKFVINPNSFGQTIENIFYLSFLVKDGFIAIVHDAYGLPVIYCTDPPSQDDHKKNGITRNQVIFPMTMWEWQEMKRIFDITESMIPTRAQEQKLTSATGWYS